MARDIRKALWGYRVGDTDRYLAALESRLTSRQDARNLKLTQAKRDLERAREEELTAEQAFKSVQAEYYRLSGELATLAGRSEELLERAHLDLDARERSLWKELDILREQSQRLRDTIQAVPHKLRVVIEEITTSVSPDHRGSRS
ncbi:MAG: hypothetical protein OWR62_15605, partial [Sulfobacillus thermotolerans]|nr:hypothetical protein [Sulfobacillus thermotolerans]